MEEPLPKQVVLHPLVMKLSPVAFVKNLVRFFTGSADYSSRFDAKGRTRRQAARDAGYPESASWAAESDAESQVTPMTYAPLAPKRHGSQYVIDAWGVVFSGAGKYDFRMAWDEIARVKLQRYVSRFTGMVQLRFVWLPVDPERARATFAIMREFWDDEQGGAVTNLAAVVEPPPELVAQATTALTAFAGDRFDGRTEEVHSPYDRQ